MSFYPVSPDIDVEVLKRELNPKKNYAIDASDETTGVEDVFPHWQSIPEYVNGGSANVDGFQSFNLETWRNGVSSLIEKSQEFESPKAKEEAYKALSRYMDEIDKFQTDSFKRSKKRIKVQSFNFNTDIKDYRKKQIITKNLLPYYRNKYHNTDFAFTNYNTVNFIKSDVISNNFGILYPNKAKIGSDSDAFGRYSLHNKQGFTIEFWINQRFEYPTTAEDVVPGVILHLPGQYCISIFPSSDDYASARDLAGSYNTFRVCLQTGEYADIDPKLIYSDPDSYSDNGYVLISTDGALRKNNWHHVVFRWGGPKVNRGKVSLHIDGSYNTGIMPEFSKFPLASRESTEQKADFLILGNRLASYPDDKLYKLFSQRSSYCYGVDDLITQYDNIDKSLDEYTEAELLALDESIDLSFDNIANCELHEIRIFSKYRSNEDILTYMSNGISTDSSLLFYVPVLFNPSINNTKKVLRDTDLKLQFGGIYFHPGCLIEGYEDFPVNRYLPFSTGGLYSCVEEHLIDTKNAVLPLAYGIMNKTDYQYDNIQQDLTGYYESKEEIKRRNITILPNDNGLFRPNYESLLSLFFVNDLGIEDKSLVNLSNIAPGFSTKESIDTLRVLPDDYIDLYNETQKAALVNSDSPTVFSFSLLNKFEDVSSNLVCLIELSSIFYGRKLDELSLKIRDKSIFSSILSDENVYEITFKDDGYGAVYRADCITEKAIWNTVGNILYYDGLIFIKNPFVYNLGNSIYRIEFEGSHKIISQKISIDLPSGFITNSDNETHPRKGVSTLSEDDYVAISGVNLHDQNFNIVGRVQLAQPIIKNANDEISLKVKCDF